MSPHALFRAMGLCALAAVSWCSVAHAAWMWDQNDNKLDDRMESVEVLGLNAAHVGGLTTGRLRFAVMNVTAPFQYGVYVGYDHHPTDSDAAALAAAGAPVQVRYQSIDYIRSVVTLAQAQAIAQLPGVQRIETIPMLYAVNDIATRVLRARDSDGQLYPSVWRDLGVTGRGVVVAILDTGVNDEADSTVGYVGHESLRGKFVGGGSFWAGQPALNTPLTGSENPKHAVDPEATYHGTHVAGTAIGSGGPEGTLNGAAPGLYAGVAPDAKLVDCKVLSDAGLGFGAADALDWLIYHRFDSWGLTGADAIYHGVQVANMSLGGTDNSDGTDASSAAVNAAHKAGIVVCVATGNDGNTNWIASPSAADLALSVGSFTDNNTINRGDDIVADYSNEGPRLADPDADHLDEMKPSVLGSGTGILSALGDPTSDGRQYHHINGTSMATPTIAGLCALIRGANPGLSPDQVRQLLQDTSDHRTDHGKQPAGSVDPFGLDPNYHPSWGWGEPDGVAAVKEAQNATTTQVIQIKTTAVRGPDGVRVDWVSQREISLFRYEVQRAPDAFGGPGDWTDLTQIVVPSPAIQIHRVPNRHSYTYTDLDPSLNPVNPYWYRVRWMDQSGRMHNEPPMKVRIMDSPVIARVRFSWTHNYSDGDLAVRYGTGMNTVTPSWVRAAPGAPAADSVVTRPGQALLGTLQHYFHFDLTADDLVGTFLPPSAANPWFLSVKEGGFLNTKGRVNDFSVTVFNGPTSTTYTSPNPQTDTVEGQETVFWIPLDPATSVNHAPVLAPVGARTVGEGLALAITLSATDADAQPLTYSASGLPAGATFNAGTRRFDWTPGFSAAGSYSVRFRVADNAFPTVARDSEDVAITVTDRNPGDNLAPRLDPLSDRQALVGERLSFRVTARDPEGATLTYSIQGAMPPGVTFNGSTGTFEWIPSLDQIGTRSFTFVATDPGSAHDEEGMLVTVSDAQLGPAPALPCEGSTSVITGVVDAGIDPISQGVSYHAFTVPIGTQRIEGTLNWALGPPIDLDFYLLDADSNVVQSAAGSTAPEQMVVNNPPAGGYIWKVVAFASPDTTEYSITTDVCVAHALSANEPMGRMAYGLGPSAPNPFRDHTLISFTLPESGPVRLRIYDLAGRAVRTLQDGRLTAGVHRMTWDRHTDEGGIAPAGLYFYRFEAGGHTFGRKVILLR